MKLNNLQFLIIFISVALLLELVVSFWLNSDVNWGYIFNVSIGALIGTMISIRIRQKKSFKNVRNSVYTAIVQRRPLIVLFVIFYLVLAITPDGYHKEIWFIRIMLIIVILLLFLIQ